MVDVVELVVQEEGILYVQNMCVLHSSYMRFYVCRKRIYFFYVLPALNCKINGTCMFGVCICINTLTKCFMSWKYSSLLYILNLILCAILIWVVAFLRGAMKWTRDEKKNFSSIFLHVALYKRFFLFFVWMMDWHSSILLSSKF